MNKAEQMARYEQFLGGTRRGRSTAGFCRIESGGNHLWFTPEDFTWEEIDRGNVLAVAVINEGRKICKQCGFELEEKTDESK